MRNATGAKPSRCLAPGKIRPGTLPALRAFELWHFARQLHSAARVALRDDVEMPATTGDVLQLHGLPGVGQDRRLGFGLAIVVGAQAREPVDETLQEVRRRGQHLPSVVGRRLTADNEKVHEEPDQVSGDSLLCNIGLAEL